MGLVKHMDFVPSKLAQDWIDKSRAAAAEAQSYLDKKGNPLPGKALNDSWPKWEGLRKEADKAWYTYYTMLRTKHTDS